MISKLAIIGILLVVFGCEVTPQTNVEPGQVWERIWNQDNPFEETEIDRFLVLSVDNGYVQYKDLGSGRIDSDNLDGYCSFTFNKYLKNNAPHKPNFSNKRQ